MGQWGGSSLLIPSPDRVAPTFHPAVRKSRGSRGPSLPEGVLAPNAVGTGLEALSLPPFTPGVGRGPAASGWICFSFCFLALLVEKSKRSPLSIERWRQRTA